MSYQERVLKTGAAFWLLVFFHSAAPAPPPDIGSHKYLPDFPCIQMETGHIVHFLSLCCISISFVTVDKSFHTSD